MDSLKEKREVLGFSCGQMAKMLNISKTFYWQIENCERRLSYEMALKIADIFRLKPDDIFYEHFKSKIK